MADTRWRERAGCRSVDPELFFPTAQDGPAYVAQVSAAKSVCAGCPVRAQCLADAARMPYGIAGGLTPEERRGHQRAAARRPRVRARASCVTTPAMTGVDRAVVTDLDKLPAGDGGSCDRPGGPS